MDKANLASKVCLCGYDVVRYVDSKWRCTRCGKVDLYSNMTSSEIDKIVSNSQEKPMREWSMEKYKEEAMKALLERQKVCDHEFEMVKINTSTQHDRYLKQDINSIKKVCRKCALEV